MFTNVNSKDIYWCMLIWNGETISMDYRKRIRGEHLRVNEQQMDALQKRFHIQVWPTYILMDRQGRFRELPHNHVEEELLKELEKKN